MSAERIRDDRRAEIVDQAQMRSISKRLAAQEPLQPADEKFLAGKGYEKRGNEWVKTGPLDRADVLGYSELDFKTPPYVVQGGNPDQPHGVGGEADRKDRGSRPAEYQTVRLHPDGYWRIRDIDNDDPTSSFATLKEAEVALAAALKGGYW